MRSHPNFVADDEGERGARGLRQNFVADDKVGRGVRGRVRTLLQTTTASGNSHQN